MAPRVHSRAKVANYVETIAGRKGVKGAPRRDRLGKIVGWQQDRRCYFDGVDINGRRADAWHCGEDVHPRAWHDRRRLERQKARLLRRPRCMICDAPLDPRLRGDTCSRACAVKRWNWFRRAA